MWCQVDKCPSEICGGPHYEVETNLGMELLRADQKPMGEPTPRGQALLEKLGEL